MKIFLFLFFLVPAIGRSQDSLFNCGLNKETDPYTKETIVSTGFFDIDNAKVDINATKFEIDIFFSITGTDLCYDNNSTAMIYFEGSKTKLTARNGGTMNCDGYFHLLFKNSATPTSLLQKMMNQKISQIVFTGNNKKETVLTFGVNQQKFRDMLNCIVAEGKMLIR